VITGQNFEGSDRAIWGEAVISRPTIFVIGAGASTEFGLPVGGALKTRVADTNDKVRRVGGPVESFQQMD
jgi:hypothetical protein